MKKGFVLAVTVVALSLLASAAPKVKRQNVKLFLETQVAGTQLKPGEYQVAVEGDTATVFHNGKEVAKTAIRSEDAGHKFETNSMLYGEDGKTLREIRLEGAKNKVVGEGG